MMIFLTLEVQSTEHNQKNGQLQAWVNVKHHTEALDILSEELALQGWSMTEVIDHTETDESDYFAPCHALDAFNEAKQGLLALRFS